MIQTKVTHLAYCEDCNWRDATGLVDQPGPSPAHQHSVAFHHSTRVVTETRLAFVLEKAAAT